MTFSEAMEAAILRDERVCRGDWDQEYDDCTYIYYNGITKYPIHNTPDKIGEYCPTVEDILATDWEIW